VVQVVALAKHKAFRQADMHNNFFRDCLRLEIYRLKNIFGWQMPQGTRATVYIGYAAVGKCLAKSVLPLRFASQSALQLVFEFGQAILVKG